MRAGVNAIWAVPLAVLAAMLLIIVSDVGAIATQLRGAEFDTYQALQPYEAVFVGMPKAAPKARELATEASQLRNRPASVLYAELGFLFIVGLGVVILFARAGTLWAGVLTVVALAGVQAFGWFLFTSAQMLLDAMALSLALALVFAAGLVTRGLVVRHARKQLTRAFAHKLSAAAIEKIARKPELLKLTGESRPVTALHCAIRDYGSLCESFASDPAGLLKLIGTVMTPLLDIARETGGTIANYDSASFTVYWNAPLDDPDHARHACEAANRTTESLAGSNQQLAQQRRFDGAPLDAIEIGVGIATSQAAAGALGTDPSSYAAIGGCIALAGRLQELSAQYGYAIIVDPDTKQAADADFAFLEVDDIAGPHDTPVALYAILGNPMARGSPQVRALSTFHDHIFQSLRSRQWQMARLLIEQCRKLSGASQKLYDLHDARISWYEKNPPPADWDGAFRPILK
ncbi:MAG: adenylate/guanylate cyclase domain-containing protein [Rhizomicrobium sp.]